MMEKVDIKSLARELKTGQSSNTSTVKKSTTPLLSKKAATRKATNQKWSAFLSEIQLRKDLNSEGCVYIDSDLYDVLRLLKLNTGVKIGFLVSHLVEQFILEHKDDIQKSLRPKRNRYLEK